MSGVLAAVVTYNPGPALAAHLGALRTQSADVLVIDNASRDADDVARVVADAGCVLVANDRNLGVAGALNQAVAHAKVHGYEWLATFDQDSLCPPGGIDSLLRLVRDHPRGARIGLAALASRDRATGREYHHALDVIEETPQWRVLRTVITSGSMVRIAALPSQGFDERLFIDSVDHALCLGLRRAGWLVAEARQPELHHSIGHATLHRLFGRTVVCTHHSPLRLYYRNRNHLDVCARNLLFDPVWALKSTYQLAANNVAVLLFEEERGAKARAMLRGVRDFVLRRFGPAR